MFLLRTFGVVSLQRRDASSTDVPTPRRTLALLALLAASDRAGVSRDRVSALLWSDSDHEAARNSLRQTLFRLKQATGASVIIGTTELRLDGAQITCDVTGFREAIDLGRHREAIDWYRGPFLDGFYRRGADDFERWTENVRQELALQHRRALQSLANEAAAAGNVSEEIAYRRQLCTIDPFDAQFALQYMSTLAHNGRAGEALRHFAVHEQALRAEIGVAPSPDVSSLANALRRPPDSPSDRVVPLAASLDRPNITQVDVVPVPPARTAIHVPQTHTPRRRVSLQATLSIVAVVAFASLLLARPPAPQVTAEADVVRVDVQPSEPNGTTHELARTLASMIAARLDAVGGIQTSADSSTAEQTAIPVTDVVLSLRTVAHGHTVRLLVDSRGDEPAHTTVLDIPGDSADLPALADRAAFQLLPPLVRSPLRVATRRASRSTTSLVALKLFIAAEAKVHEALYPEAMQLLDSSVSADTQFAYAFHRLAEVADWNGRVDTMLAASRRATQLLHHVPEDDRLLISSVAAWRAGDIDGAERGLRRLVTDYPNDLEGWYFLGEVQFHSAPLRGRDFTRARHAFEQVMRGGARRRDVTIHLSRIAMKLGDRAAAESITWLDVADSVRIANHDKQPYQLMDTTAASLHRLEQTLRASNSASFLWEVVDRGAVYSENVQGAARIAELLRSAPWSVETRRGALLYAAALEAARGRFRAADSMLANSEFAFEGRFVFFRSVLAIAPFSTLDDTTRRQLHRGLMEWKPDGPHAADAHLNALAPRYRPAFLGALALQLGRVTPDHAMDEARTEPNGNVDLEALDRAYVGWLHAQRALARADTVSALARLVRSEPQVTLGSIKSLLGTYAPIRWLRAELLRGTGRLREAQQWYDAMVSTTALETPYLAPSHLRSAQIAEQLGERANALRHYRAFVSVWRDCEPTLRQLVDSARVRIAHLER